GSAAVGASCRGRSTTSQQAWRTLPTKGTVRLPHRTLRQDASKQGRTRFHGTDPVALRAEPASRPHPLGAPPLRASAAPGFGKPIRFARFAFLSRRGNRVRAKKT